MAWNVNPSADELSTLVEVGMIYRDTRRYREAREVFMGLRALRPGNELADIGLGTISFAEGRYEDALARYENALQINPCSAYAQALMGEAHLFRKDYAKARGSLRRACELDPDGPHGSLGRALLGLVDCMENGRPTNLERRPAAP